MDSSLFDSEHAFKKAKESLEKGDGIGQPLISKVLKDMPGMTEHSIRDSLSRLKASGHYALTLLNITRQIEVEAEAAPAFPPFPPPPMGGVKPAEIVQILHTLSPKLYTEPLKKVVQSDLTQTERPEGRVFTDNSQKVQFVHILGSARSPLIFPVPISGQVGKAFRGHGTC